MTIRKRKTWIAIVAIALAGANIASTAIAADVTAVTTTSTAPPGQTSQANRVAAPFSYFAGSPENAVALATALRNGTTATLMYAPTSASTDTQPTTTDITVPTKPMGWGNVSHALALAAYSLHQAGIEQPTAAQLQAALNGGAVADASGKSVTLPGVLQQRASGMGWGKIAQSYGTTIGAVNRGIRTSWTAAAAPVSPSGTMGGATTASSSPGVATASGRAASSTTTAGSPGVVTASGATSGQGNASGRGIVTASGGASSGATTALRGGSSGVVTGNGAASSVANAGSGNGAAHGSGNGNGKGKGG